MPCFFPEAPAGNRRKGPVRVSVGTAACVLVLLGWGCAVLKPSVPARIPAEIPVPAREFRVAWVATVANIDWPSEPGLPSDEQKREVTAILDKARELNLNAVILQVRPQCDAFYPSEMEPWSYFLTGRQGKPPEPYYDPLAFWIEEAHDRGLELHAWFNPYRAHHPKGGEITECSVVKTRPGIVRRLKGGYYWLDPGEKETRDYSIAVIMDVVRRYDIDGVHLDDYFYPYPSYNGGEDFPDDESWAEYRRRGGGLTRGEWRRENVNRFVRRLYRAIKKEKPRVKFGMSPFGIWRPRNPESILGLDQYDVLYADARLWLNKGWVDYWTPQLYWPINRIPQSYPVLLGWWVRENRRNRNLWPGLYTSRIVDERGVDENINQIMVTRGFVPAGPGNVHFSMKALMENRGGIADALATGPYVRPALVPPSPWLDDRPPDAPRVRTEVIGGDLVVSWEPRGKEEVFRWVVYVKQGEDWRYEILNRKDRSFSIRLPGAVPCTGGEIDLMWCDVPEEDSGGITRVAVSAVDRTGNESVRTVVEIRDIRRESASE